MAATPTNIQDDTKSGVNPIFAIGIAISIAFLISGLGLLVFLKSDTRETVRLIQQQNSAVIDAAGAGVDTSTAPTNEEIEAIRQEIQNTLNGLPPSGGQDDFSDQALGL